MNALLVICSLGVFSLVAEIINLKRWLILFVALGLAVSVVLVVLDWNTSLAHYHRMVVFDNFSLAFSGVILITTMIWFWMSGDYFIVHHNKTAKTALILFAVTGAIIMTSFNNMAMLFLGIEILSISMYVLAGSYKENLLSNEAAFKYLLMGSFATGFLLLGIALIYGATGTFQIDVLTEKISTNAHELPPFFYPGVLLVLVGMTFKIAAAPFHFWAPDVYEGSPTPITAFMATVVKIAAFAAFYKIFSGCFLPVQNLWLNALQIIAVLTLIIANVIAVYQNNVKRLLAYSSVGHAGYALLAIIAKGEGATGILLYYLVSYSIASLAAFVVLGIIEKAHESTAMEQWNGLHKRNPVLAITMTIALLSLAGIPPLAGFFAKYMVFASAIEQGYVGLVMVAILTSLIGVYYYFRIIIAMYYHQPIHPSLPFPIALKLVMILLIILNVIFGVYPDILRFLSL